MLEMNHSFLRSEFSTVRLRSYMQTGALLLDGNTLNYFGKNIPINLVLAVVAEVVLLGGAEYYRITNGLVSTKLTLVPLHKRALE